MPGEEFAPLSSRDRSREYDLSFWYPFITAGCPWTFVFGQAQNPPALLRMLRAPASVHYSLFPPCKISTLYCFWSSDRSAFLLRGSLIFVTDHRIDSSSVARSSLVRQSMRESYGVAKYYNWSHCCIQDFEKGGKICVLNKIIAIFNEESEFLLELHL